MNNPAQLTSILDQAAFIDEIISRCTMRDGGAARTADLTILAADVNSLKSISDRLWLMAPFEGQIRKVVTGR